MVNPKHHIFLCGGGKLVGDKKGICHTRDSAKLVQRLIEEIEDRELSGEVMLSMTSCFGVCDKGPVMVVYPEGVWYGNLTPDGIARIAEEHLENGEAVRELQI